MIKTTKEISPPPSPPKKQKKITFLSKAKNVMILSTYKVELYLNPEINT